MPAMRVQAPGAAKFYAAGISVYPEEELFRETTFIAYYLHWSEKDIWELPHQDRRRYCEEISDLHLQLGGSRKPKNPFDPF